MAVICLVKTSRRPPQVGQSMANMVYSSGCGLTLDGVGVVDSATAQRVRTQIGYGRWQIRRRPGGPEHGHSAPDPRPLATPAVLGHLTHRVLPIGVRTRC